MVKKGKTNYDKELVTQLRELYPETNGLSIAAVIDFALRLLILHEKTKKVMEGN